MTTHRPHPITGPWPYDLDGSRVDPDELVVGLVARIPAADSLIYADPADAILYDGCDRCEQHASHPIESLDDDNLGRLWLEMVRVERDETARAHYRTRAEAQACRELRRVACFVERIAPNVDAWVWPLAVRVAMTDHLLVDVLTVWAEQSADDNDTR